MDNLPLYKLTIDEHASGMDYMGLVDHPAHGKGWLAFNNMKKFEPVKNFFNEEQRVVTGVAIATDLQIYRRSPDGFEYNVYFTKKDTKAICQALFKNGYMHNVNEMHDMNKDVSDIYLFESYFIDDQKSNIPSAFKNQNLQPGSWIVSYKVDNDKVWEKIKNGEFYGFSIEGWFKEIEVSIKKKNEMKKKSLKERVFGKAKKEEVLKFDKEKHGEATTVDGVVVSWEGELPEVGGSLFIQDSENEEMILATAGEYSIEVNGTSWVLMVDEAGLISSMEEVQFEEEEEEVEEEEMEETVETMKAMVKDYEEKLETQKEEFNAKISEIVSDVESLQKAYDELLNQEKKEKKKHSSDTRPGWRKKRA